MTTTPTPAPATSAAAAPAKLTASDICQRLDEIDARLNALGEAIATMTAGLQHAATATPAPGTFGEMMIDTIIMGYSDKGEPTYKAKGTPYQKFGVRVWAEILPALGIDPATLKPGPNEITPTIRARVLLGENGREDGTTGIGPRKVTGKA